MPSVQKIIRNVSTMLKLWLLKMFNCNLDPPPLSSSPFNIDLASGTLSAAITWIPCIQFQERKVPFSVEAQNDHSVLHKYSTQDCLSILNTCFGLHFISACRPIFCFIFHSIPHLFLPPPPLESCVIISYIGMLYIQCNHDVIYVLFSIVWHLHGIVLLTVY